MDLIIKEISFGSFGKFHDHTIALQPGLNIIYGQNEAGKSTLHAFIRGMLFGIEKSRGRASKDDLYTKYEPWDSPAVYHGSMVIEIDGEDYRIQRNFYKKEKRISVTQVSTGREVVKDESGMKKLLKGLSENVYCNTVSVEQLKAKTESELAQELQKYITNLSMSKSTKVDVTRAVSYLMDKKKQLEKTIPNEKICELQQTIAKEQETVRYCEQLDTELGELTKQLEEIKRKLHKYTDATSKEKLSRIMVLPAIREKYKSYKEVKTQIAQFEERMESLMERTNRAVDELDNSELIQQHLSELHQLRQEKQQYEDQIRMQKQEWENSKKPSKFNAKVTGMSIVFLGILTCVIPIGNAVIRCGIGIAIVFFGIIQYVYKATKDEHDAKHVEEIEKQFERNIFKLHSKRHDILLQHRVTNETQLVMKYNDLTKNELEREQLLERKAEYALNLKNLREKVEKLEMEIESYMKYFMDRPEVSDSYMEQLTLITKQYEEETLTGKDKYQSRCEEVKAQIDRICWTLESNHDQEAKLLHDQEEYRHLNEVKAQTLREIAAIGLSVEALKELSSMIHDTFGARLNEVISDIFAKISNQEYSNVLVNENLNLKVLKDNRYVSLDNLSAGTMDQMYLALRLAVASLLFPEDKLPIILDDAFALYDDNRTERVLNMLREQSRRQIILMTCHKREHQIATEDQMDANLIELV